MSDTNPAPKDREELRTKIAFTLQESGVYPYPEFVEPLVKLFDAYTTRAVGEAERTARLDEIELLPDVEIFLGNDGDHVQASIKHFADRVIAHKERRRADLAALPKDTGEAPDEH